MQQEIRAKISKTLKKRWAEDAEYRESRKNTTISEDARKRMAETLRRKWAEDTEFRRKMMDSFSRRNVTVSDKISEAIRAKWTDPEYREKTLSAMDRYYSSGDRNLLRSTSRQQTRRRTRKEREDEDFVEVPDVSEIFASLSPAERVKMMTSASRSGEVSLDVLGSSNAADDSRSNMPLKTPAQIQAEIEEKEKKRKDRLRKQRLRREETKRKKEAGEGKQATKQVPTASAAPVDKATKPSGKTSGRESAAPAALAKGVDVAQPSEAPGAGDMDDSDDFVDDLEEEDAEKTAEEERRERIRWVCPFRDLPSSGSISQPSFRLAGYATLIFGQHSTQTMRTSPLLKMLPTRCCPRTTPLASCLHQKGAADDLRTLPKCLGTPALDQAKNPADSAS
eukprot:scaffold873_cov252-Pinguiococcus_pyrenoidosus.AAC.2